jgi:hypothetical protein
MLHGASILAEHRVHTLHGAQLEVPQARQAGAEPPEPLSLLLSPGAALQQATTAPVGLMQQDFARCAYSPLHAGVHEGPKVMLQQVGKANRWLCALLFLHVQNEGRMSGCK